MSAASPTGSPGSCGGWGWRSTRTAPDRRSASDAGNLLARIPGATAQSVLLCAHMDTVPLAAPVEPVLRDGRWENANDGIVGADNKTAIAVILEVARRATAGQRAPAGRDRDPLHGVRGDLAARLA